MSEVNERTIIIFKVNVFFAKVLLNIVLKFQNFKFHISNLKSLFLTFV